MNIQRLSSSSEPNIEPVSSTDDPILRHRQLIRGVELEQVIEFLPRKAKVLEIGAGAGWQAAELAKRGFEVNAIDIPSSNYSSVRVWPVEDYDGVRIPLDDDSVDALFSSNVLEHVPHIEAFQKEMQRVLKPGGVAIHVMPSASWRLWTSLTFYLHRSVKVAKYLFLLKRPKSSSDPLKKSSTYHSATKRGPLQKLFPARHGERGNFLTEVYWFSRFYWIRMFKSTGWKVTRVQPNGVLYSGQRLLGESLALPLRRKLSSLFGSSCILYVLENPKSGNISH